MKSLSHFFIFLIVRFVVNLFKLIPFWLLYALSDGLYWLQVHVVKYRFKVVRSNMEKAFPGISPEELEQKVNAFWKHFCDLTLESLKGYGIPKKALQERIQIDPNDYQDLTELYAKYHALVGSLGHLGNWEWGVIEAANMIGKRMIGFYRPLTNQLVERYIRKKIYDPRLVFLSVKHTQEAFAQYSHDGVDSVFMLVSDQSPSSTKNAIWVNFLNQPTACLHGAEKYARIHKLPLVYFRVFRVARGHYRIGCQVLCEQPHLLPEGEPTRLYMKALEADIYKRPDQWLWSHKRWKLEPEPHQTILN